MSSLGREPQSDRSNVQGDSKLLSGFPWPIIFKLEITK
jgi:hypothetical protein